LTHGSKFRDENAYFAKKNVYSWHVTIMIMAQCCVFTYAYVLVSNIDCIIVVYICIPKYVLTTHVSFFSMFADLS
jgi:hypothetical protein